MAKIIGLPKLSPTMEEGTLVKWVKKEGEEVAVDDLLAEVETDKATMEFRSFDRGVLLKILVPEGETLAPDTPVAIIGNKGEDVSKLLESAKSGGKAPEAKPAEAKPTQAKAAETNGTDVEHGQQQKAPAQKATSGSRESPASEPSQEPAQQAQASKVAEPAATKTSRGGNGRVLASPLVRRCGNTCRTSPPTVRRPSSKRSDPPMRPAGMYGSAPGVSRNDARV